MWQRILLAALLAASLVAADLDAQGTVLVTCGSLVKLEHDRQKVFLHSHEVAYGYGRGSGQQSVTGFPGKDSGESLWVVRAAEGERCKQGTPLKTGVTIRLQHMATRRWLHSHQFYSPLSSNQEVSCFGSDDESNSADSWVLELEDKGQFWQRDMRIRLKHLDTGVYLATHNIKYQRPIPGHTEVFGSSLRSADSLWRATEGVFFPQRTAAAAAES